MALVLVVVLGGGQQAGDVANAFGDALPEEQLGSQSQVLRVFDEAEADHGSLTCTQLVLQREEALHTNSHKMATKRPVIYN